MLAQPGRKSLSLPRLALALTMAFGVLAQSLLDLSGQTHDLLHAEAGETYTAHHDHDHDHHHDAPGEDHSDRDPAKVLHLLMHQSCGAHCIWIAGTAAARVLTGVVPAGMPPETIVPVGSSHRAAPFRPPIRA